MSKDTGKELPWGNLTGIRPAKIPGMLFEQGMDEGQVRKTMKETYLISDEKLNLAIDISRRESRILSDINYKEGYSLYVGIPFAQLHAFIVRLHLILYQCTRIRLTVM